ncbi:ATP-dependent OLD family endonuclease [Burkholderia pseudomallei]|uniref:ATP-dependent nuclease n=2 Tax=Burkholderia pseudomallei TaxID=28450 RepID=UPI000975F0EE|nr:ATP-dependent endonuclease [Burkholderia pseudomallei]MBD2953686.1 AAA family ATPase [Burkholderia pseudomallei]MBD2972049.1 AAA family ATPase [Burkholderia pseudomallei]MBO2978693.1 ATP-dependent endonuclease [Burkholderia pseudomallei]MCW0024658.1 ATP-dependent endonuclease [Burkholderia pseudomallei]MCW0156039.1 ATP-dependent endonuclease [Burkholderia pseudomallei]
MKLSEITIQNFRLLRDARMRLDTAGITTILIGPNNSGKTSAIEALLAFLQRPSRQLSLNDFSLGCRNAFAKFEQHVLAPHAPAAGAPAAGLAPNPSTFPELPVLSLRLKFDYDDTGPDLAVAGELLMDLEDDTSSVTVEARFAPASPENLAQVYVKDRDTDQTLADYLATTLHDHYKLDLYKLSPDGAQFEKLLDRGILQRLIRVDVVSAQRHIDDREEGGKVTRLSTLLHAHYERRYKVDAPADFKALEKTLGEQSAALSPQYVKAFDGLMKGLAKFGYPESPKLTVRAELSADGLFKDSTRVFYATEISPQPLPVAAEASIPIETFDLPERYNGLGFKNLIYIVLRLKSFREDVESDPENRPRVHLIVVEEPEVHMHPQMQAVFVQKVSEFLAPADGEAGVQLLLTTHSSHMAANSGFAPVRYFRRKKGSVEIKDLLAFETSAKSEPEKAAMEFLRKYLTTTRCDMFFADKLVFIEGQVERMLLPRLISALQPVLREKLTSTYLCTVEVGGAYAHIFRKLIEFLDLPALVITDLDAIDGTTKKKARVDKGHTSSNATLKQWLPGSCDLPELLAATPAMKTAGQVRIAYQVPEAAGQPCARSFEEAFVYANAAWLLANKTKLLATGDRFMYSDEAAIIAGAYDIEPPKVDFALDLLANEGWATPKYINEGLEWLATQ